MKTSKAPKIDGRTKAGRVLARKRAAMALARAARAAQVRNRKALKATLAAQAQDGHPKGEVAPPAATRGGRRRDHLWRVLVGLLIAVAGAVAPATADCALSFEDTGQYFTDPYGTPNARLRVTYLTPDCVGAPQFTWQGGLGYGVSYTPGPVGPGVFDVHLVATEPGAYWVEARDGAGQAPVAIKPEIEPARGRR